MPCTPDGAQCADDARNLVWYDDATGEQLRLWLGELPDDVYLTRVFLWLLDAGIYGAFLRYQGDGTRAVQPWYVRLDPQTEPSHEAAIRRAGLVGAYNTLLGVQPQAAAAVPHALDHWSDVQERNDENERDYWRRMYARDWDDFVERLPKLPSAMAIGFWVLAAGIAKTLFQEVWDEGYRR